MHPDFVRISQSTENIERTAAGFLASGPDTSDQRPMEGLTRALSIGAATISILAAATALESTQADTHADPFTLQSGGDGHHFQRKRRRTFSDACSGMAPDRRKLWLARIGLFDHMDDKNSANWR